MILKVVSALAVVACVSYYHFAFPFDCHEAIRVVEQIQPPKHSLVRSTVHTTGNTSLWPHDAHYNTNTILKSPRIRSLDLPPWFRFEKVWVWNNDIVERFEKGRKKDIKSELNTCFDIISSCAQNGTNSNVGYVLDIGANSGLIGTLGAAAGMHAVMVEPQPGCFQRISASILANPTSLAQNVQVINAFVHDSQGLALVDHIKGCDQNFHLLSEAEKNNPKKLDKNPNMQKNGFSSLVPMIRVDDIVSTFEQDTDICLVKIDVEGNEWKVLQTMRNTLKSRKVQNFIIEVNLMRETSKLRSILEDEGYSITSITDDGKNWHLTRTV
eukprot:m.344012 g.344012  ORF g.344012 m.344012 type:complete len:326 (-) comp23677_c0_seq1:217-1194(-)